jgi:hypothetical protein
MTTPDFGTILIDAVKTDVVMIWTNWPTWAHDQPIIWVIPAVMVAGVVRSVWPKKRRTR